jgi:integrase
MSHRQTITCLAKDYLKHRRALGFALESRGCALMCFARFADQSRHCGPLTTELALRWSTLASTQGSRAQRLSVVRCFARYLAARDGRTQIPDPRLLGPNVSRAQPHIYSITQLRQLIAAATKLPTYLRPWTYSTLLGLLGCTGLRIAEALNLTRSDVDLDQGILRIEKTKFRKSRLVPLPPTATKAMRRYAQARDRDPVARRSIAFFVGGQGQALPYNTVSGTFTGLCSSLGLVSNGTLPRPRIHDLRHTFACRRILAWYEQHTDVNHAIAVLSTYLGHANVTNTYWYLTGTPELMGAAGARFERFATPKNRRRS